MAGRLIGNEVGAAEEMTWCASTLEGRNRSTNAWAEGGSSDVVLGVGVDSADASEAVEDADAAAIGSRTGVTASGDIEDEEEVEVESEVEVKVVLEAGAPLPSLPLLLPDVGSAKVELLAGKACEVGGIGGGESFKISVAVFLSSMFRLLFLLLSAGLGPRRLTSADWFSFWLPFSSAARPSGACPDIGAVPTVPSETLPCHKERTESRPSPQGTRHLQEELLR